MDDNLSEELLKDVLRELKNISKLLNEMNDSMEAQRSLLYNIDYNLTLPAT